MSESVENKGVFAAKWAEPATITALLIPLFYAAGWSYAYFYFGKFHLGLLELSIPKEYYFMYSFWAVRANIPWFVLILAASGGLIRFYGFPSTGRRTEPLGRFCEHLKVFIFPLALFLLFVAFYHFGKTAAIGVYEREKYDPEAHIVFRSYNSVEVVLKENADIDIHLREGLKGGCYRLLLRNDNRLYLFRPESYVPDPTNPVDPKPATEIIPMDAVAALRVLPYPHTCQ